MSSAGGTSPLVGFLLLVLFFLNDPFCCFPGETFQIVTARSRVGSETVFVSERDVVIEKGGEKKERERWALASCVRDGMSRNRLPDPSCPVTQGVSLHDCLRWVGPGPRGRQDLSYAVFFSRGNKHPSVIRAELGVSALLERWSVNKEAPGITTSFIQLGMQLVHIFFFFFWSLGKSKGGFWHRCCFLVDSPQTCRSD